jgi:ketosteroid isomerase-like protein
MADDSLTIARRAFDSFNEIGGDIDAGNDPPPGVFADDPEIVPFRAALEDTTYSGPSALDDFWDASRESWSELHIELERIEPFGVGVLAVGLLTGTSRETGANVESKVAFACHLRDGRVTRLASHLSEESARRELGGE